MMRRGPKSSDKWSRRHDCCIKCRTTRTPHEALGLCLKCYGKKYGQSEKGKHTRRQASLKYNEEHKEERRKQNRKYVENHPHLKWAGDTIGNHKARGHLIVISANELEKIAKQMVYCPICDCKLKWGPGKLSNSSPTLDRKSNENIIDKNSIWIICKRCNSSKQDRTIEEFIEYCKMVADKLRKL